MRLSQPSRAAPISASLSEPVPVDDDPAIGVAETWVDGPLWPAELAAVSV